MDCTHLCEDIRKLYTYVVQEENMNIFDGLEKRFSAYQLDRTSNLTNTEVQNLVSEAVLLTPSAFNAQSPRVVILFDDKSDQFWDITRDVLKEVANGDGFEETVAKLNNFKAQGTILFYTDTTTVEGLQAQFPLYADNFPIWAVQENAMLQLVIWTAFAENGIGASLQHYNPVIDAKVAEAFDIDPSWKLHAQMPFGGNRSEKVAKEKLPTSTTVIVK